jgi:histone acetyltransferase (RNA polymerase elongator complex component)
LSGRAPYLIPFYIPHEGCPDKCIYCDSIAQTHGESCKITQISVDGRIESYLRTRKGRGSRVEAAFYGGSFNCLKPAVYRRYLRFIYSYIEKKIIDGIRISIRPDFISMDFLDEMLSFGLASVEMGIQSMKSETLCALRRNYTGEDVKRAFGLLKKKGVSISAHLMPGLPGESSGDFFDSLEGVLKLKPDFIRIHPTLVLKGTELERIYRSGKYTPLTMEEACDICSKAYLACMSCNVNVLRMGLQANDVLGPERSVVAGPWHPSFGEMVHSKIYFDIVGREIEHAGLFNCSKIRILVNPKEVSKVKGLRSGNIDKLRRLSGIKNIEVKAEPAIDKLKVRVEKKG